MGQRFAVLRIAPRIGGDENFRNWYTIHHSSLGKAMHMILATYVLGQMVHARYVRSVMKRFTLGR